MGRRPPRAVAHDVEAQFSTGVTPALGAGHPVDRVHRASVPGGNPRFSPKISEVKATDQQRPAQAPENVRGHAYCSARCRLLARRRSVQAAKARHQRSPEGRLDHRDHQRTYRTRCRVRDHSSPAVLRYARLHALEVPPAPAPEPTRCVVCGRVSRWLIPARWPRVDPRDGPEGPSTTGTWGNRGQARLRLALVIFRVVDDFAGFFFDSLTLSRLLRSAAIRSTTLAGASASWTTNSSPAILASITDRSSA